MEPGKRVRQGQVIGFVGSTGMSTGAHVHYEILVNGRFVDPMRVKLPRGRSLEGPVMASFEKERDRLDAQMNNRGNAARVSDAGARRRRCDRSATAKFPDSKTALLSGRVAACHFRGGHVRFVSVRFCLPNHRARRILAHIKNGR